MASRVRDITLQPGGLNLLPPADRLPGDDCQRLDGWAPSTSIGRLQQGLGFAILASPAYLAFVDSICQVGGRLYYGGNTKLFQEGRAADAPIDGGYDTLPLGLTAAQNHCWAINRNLQRKDDGTDTSNWTTETPGCTPPDYYTGTAPTATPTAASTSLVAGAYDVYVTFENQWGHEGNPTPITTVSISAGDKITVDRPTRAEATVSGWKVYIKSPGLGQAYQIPQNVLAYATTSFDYDGAAGVQDDESVLAFDVPLAFDHDPAPAATVAADDLFNDRIVVANSAAHPNRIWYTHAGEPSYFPGSAGDPDGNWLDVGQDNGDPVLAVTVRPGLLMIYRRRSIWRHQGDFDDDSAKLEPVVPEMGIVGVRAVTRTAVGDFACSDEGIHRIADWPVKVSQKIEPIFLGTNNESVYESILDSWRDHCALGFENGRLWFSYPGDDAATQTGNTHALMLHVETGRWFAHSWPVGFGAFLNCGDNTAEFAAGGLTYVYRLSPSVGAPWDPLVGYQSGYQDCDLADREKTFPDVTFSHNTRGMDLHVTAWVDKGAASYLIGTIHSTTLTAETLALVYPVGDPNEGQPIRAFSLSIEISGDGAATGEGVLIEGPIVLHWYDRPRQAKVFDSGETDHGIQGVKLAYSAELDIDVPGDFWDLKVYSDGGGGELVLQEEIALTPTTGREQFTLPLALDGDPIPGRLFRYFVKARTGTSPGPADNFELYGLRVRLLPIGVYLDGLRADFWMSTPRSIGV